MKESGISPTKAELDEAIEQIIAINEARPGRRRKEGQDGRRQTESRRDAQNCYGDIRENTEEKVLTDAAATAAAANHSNDEDYRNTSSEINKLGFFLIPCGASGLGLLCCYVNLN